MHWHTYKKPFKENNVFWIPSEKAADLLEQACLEMKSDPYSQSGRDRLIAGSRGILQGTTSMLVIFDESQVRKLCRDCKKVIIPGQIF